MGAGNTIKKCSVSLATKEIQMKTTVKPGQLNKTRSTKKIENIRESGDVDQL